MRWYRGWYEMALSALVWVIIVGCAIGSGTVAAAQDKTAAELRRFATHGWTWSGWDAALMHPKTPEAQYNRGVMHATGQGQPQNDNEAVKWFRQAVRGGHVPAQCNLGVLYAIGRGVPQDNAQAWAWFDVAAAQGDKNAWGNKQVIAASMTPAELDRAQRLAREYREKYGFPFRN